jgi:TPR repeat protein
VRPCLKQSNSNEEFYQENDGGKKKKRKKMMGWSAHACDLGYLEAEIRRITVQSQPGQKVHETLSQKNPSQKKGWWSGSRYRL